MANYGIALNDPSGAFTYGVTWEGEIYRFRKRIDPENGRVLTYDVFSLPGQAVIIYFWDILRGLAGVVDEGRCLWLPPGLVGAVNLYLEHMPEYAGLTLQEFLEKTWTPGPAPDLQNSPL